MGNLGNCKPVSTVVLTVTKDAALTSGTNAIMYIEPIDDNFVVAAADFSYTHDSNNNTYINHTNNSGGYTNGVKLSDSSTAYASGNKVKVDIDLLDTFSPSANTEFNIDLGGKATRVEDIPRVISGTYDVDVTNCVQDGDAGDTTGVAYSASGVAGSTSLIITRTFTCSTGYYFASDPQLVKTSVGNYADNYSQQASAHVRDSLGRLTAVTIQVYFTHPADQSSDITGHNLDFAPTGSVIDSSGAGNLITGYAMVTTNISSSGEIRGITIYGTAASSAKLTITKDGSNTYDFTSKTFTSSATDSGNLTIGSDGTYSISDLTFASGTGAYAFSLQGGTSPATNTTVDAITNNNPFTWTLNQLADITITTTLGSAISWGTYLNTPTYTNNVLTVAPSTQFGQTEGAGNYGDEKALSIAVTGPGGKNLYLRRQPVFSNTVAYDTAGNNDFSNTLSSANNGSTWEVGELAATGNGTNTITISGPKYGVDTSGTASVASVLQADNFINQPPISSNVNASCDKGGNVTVTLTATDNNGDSLTYSTTSTPSNGSLGSVSGANVVYTHDNSSNLTDSFTFKANDTYEDSNTSTVTITVGVSPGASITTDGNYGVYLIPVVLGTAAGTFKVHFNAASVPDRIQILFDAAGTSNTLADMEIQADSLWVGDGVSSTNPANGTTSGLNEYTYVGSGGNATGAGEPGAAWDKTGSANQSITITDADVCVTGTSRSGADTAISTGASRNSSGGLQLATQNGVFLDASTSTLTTGLDHADGNVCVVMTKGVTTAYTGYIRIYGVDTSTGWYIYQTTFA